ncbi:MAG: fimbria/pilus periplasmic chaperone [Pseudomonas sp.]
MRNSKFWSASSNWLLAGLVLAVLGAPAQAVVNVDRTRVVMNRDARTVTVNLVNASAAQPALVQLWIDDGDPMAPPEKIKSPLVVLPPMFRMEPSAQRNVRLTLADEAALPTDRESAFWLNIYQIPPTAQPQPGERRVVLPLRLRIKVFVRRGALEPPQEQDAARLTFTRVAEGIRIQNPTPWHMTVSSLRIGDNPLGGGMVPPFGEIVLAATQELPASGTLAYEVLNDLGNPWLQHKEWGN